MNVLGVVLMFICSIFSASHLFPFEHVRSNHFAHVCVFDALGMLP